MGSLELLPVAVLWLTHLDDAHMPGVSGRFGGVACQARKPRVTEHYKCDSKNPKCSIECIECRVPVTAKRMMYVGLWGLNPKRENKPQIQPWESLVGKQ